VKIQPRNNKQQQNLLQTLLCKCRLQIAVDVNVISAANEAGGIGNKKWLIRLLISTYYKPRRPTGGAEV
jgi:hypothetical protein